MALRTPHLIGRDRPLRELQDALEDVGPGGSLVLVGGDAGIGKTRLIDEFAARVEDATVARGLCIEGVAYSPWTMALSTILDDPTLSSRNEIPEGVQRQLARLFPEFGEPAETDPEQGQHRLFEAIVAVLALAARRRRLVLVVDDVHWIDPVSRDLLRYLAATLRRLPILLVVAYRPEDATTDRELLAQLGRLAQHRITLRQLADDDAAAMAEYLLDGSGSADDIARVVADAEGNPLYIEELASAIGERLPQSVRELMLVRFESLDADARQLVSTAAVIGARAPRPWLAAATGLDDERVAAAARAALDSGILRPEADGYLFRHALLRDAILSALSPDELVATHRAVAEALTGHPERAPDVDVTAELARHWDAAGLAAPALEWLVTLGQEASDSYAFDAAADAYERALFWWPSASDTESAAGLDHAQLVLLAAEAMHHAGRIARAGELGWAALEENTAINRPRGIEAAGRVYALLWAVDRATDAFDFMSAHLSPHLDDAELGTRALYLSAVVTHLSEYAPAADALDAASRMMAAVEEIDDPTLTTRAHWALARCYEVAGDFDRAEHEFITATKFAREARSWSELALVQYNHASLIFSVPDLARTLALVDSAQATVDQHHLRRLDVAVRCLRAQVLAFTGDLDGATETLDTLSAASLQGKELLTYTLARALVDLMRGDHETVCAGTAMGEAGAVTEFAILILMTRAEAEAWLDRPVDARASIDRALTMVETYPDCSTHGWVAMVAIRIEADVAGLPESKRPAGGVELATQRAEKALADWTTAQSALTTRQPLIVAYSLACDAEMARLRNDNAFTAAMAAADQFDAIGYKYYATYFRVRAAEAALAANDRREGIPLLEQARGTARRHGFARIDASITAVSRRHQIRITASRTQEDADQLSSRELEVLRLLVEGRSNPDIADALYISRSTAAAHVANLLKKLGVSSRTEAASEAVRRGLV